MANVISSFRSDAQLARGIAVWARNPSGFAWVDVRGSLKLPNDLEWVRNAIEQDIKDAGLSGDALDDALDLADGALGFYRFQPAYLSGPNSDVDDGNDD